MIVAALILFFGFTKDVPFTHGLHRQGAVRVGELDPARTRRCGSRASRSARSRRSSAVEGSNAALLVMELKDSALPIHKNATAKIRPRIFLEGNFFVDLKPGTPESPALDSGDDDRDHADVDAGAARPGADVAAERLARGPQGAAGRALDGAELQADGGARTPTRRRSRRARPRAESFNDALDDIPVAERSTAQVLEALLGHRARPRPPAADPRHGAHGRRARPLREPAQGPDHQLQRDDGRVRVASRPTCARRSASWRRRCATPTARSTR